jgi:hypothetical protein
VSRLLINFLAFQAGWFACVLGAANGYPVAGPLVVIAAVAIHLYQARVIRKEAALLAIAALVGALFDTLLAKSGALSYVNGALWDGTAPYWIVAMWVLFATTLNVSMRWLHGNYLTAAIFGLVGGPLSYIAGARLGGLEFIDMTSSVIMLAAGWGLVTPALVWLAKRLDGMSNALQEPADA